ncbi:MAG TPA: hypothetical protein VK158_04605 [Acidobacteriota bacterium]|nr:hypothetical protein [Acidobacteriota bacterium]
MVLIAKVELKNAQDVLAYIRKHDLLDSQFRSSKTETHILVPVKKRFRKSGVLFEEKAADALTGAKKKPKTLKAALQDTLSDKQLQQLKSAYDLVGSIAILEIDYELREFELAIAQALLQTNPAIKTVLRKDSGHEGVYRNQKMKFLAGIDTRKTEHIENGVTFVVDVENVYFSPRLANERMRIANEVHSGESILVMFSGAAPQPIVLAKKTDAREIVGIEINPAGHECGLDGLKKNNIKNVKLICADVHQTIPMFVKEKKTFDRIVMNLPKTADQFLDDALYVSHVGTIIHYYDFLHEEEFSKAEEKVKLACKRNSMACKILGIHTCGCQGIKTYRICVDFIVE